MNLIYNDYRALDKTSKVVRDTIEKLLKVQKDMLKATQDLHNAGFKDIKFLELKAVMDVANNHLTEIAKSGALLVNQMDKRSDLIKTYHNTLR
jgi:hypothetical protein